MALTLTDTRTIWNEADDDTNFTSSTGKTEIYIADPPPVELTGSIGIAVGIATHEVYSTETAADLSDTLVYVWVLANGIQDTLQNGGIGLVLGDVTPDREAFHLAGSDQAAFRYDGISVSWQCLLVDTAILPTTYTTNWAGALINIDYANITTIGAQYKNLAKALGGVENSFIDIMRHGAGGLIVTGGTTGDRGNFEEIYLDDRSDATQKAFGICRELATKVYGLQGPLTFGSQSGISWFHEVGSTIVFEDRFVGDNRYFLKTVGLGTPGDETHFILDTCAVQTAGPGVLCDFSDGGVEELSIQDTSFSDITNGILLATDSTDAVNHIFTGNVLTGCGVFEPGIVPIRECVINSSVADSTSEDAAMLWSDDTDIENSNFNDNFYGIRHDTNGTVDYINLGFSGNTYDIIFLDTGTLTINVLGGDTPTYIAPNGGTVVIIQAIDWYFEIQDSEGTIVTNAEFRIYDSNDNELYGVETSDGTEKYTFNGTISGTDARIVTLSLDYLYFTQTLTHPSTSNSAAAPIVLSLSIDRVYENNTQEYTKTWGDRPTDDYPGVIDSYSLLTTATTNYGTSEDIIIASVAELSAFYFGPKINPGIFPSNTIVSSAKLYMYIYENPNGSLVQPDARQTKRDWVETQVTWNIYSTGNSWQSSPGIGVNDIYSGTGEQIDISIGYTGWISFNVTDDIQDWIDGVTSDMYGWIGVIGLGVSPIKIRSTQYLSDPSLRPYLEVIYTH